MQAVEGITREQHLKEVSELAVEIKNAREKAKDALSTLEIRRSQKVSDGHLTMDFHFRPNAAKKQAVTHTANFNPFLNPTPELLIKDLGERHRLLFNKFNIFQNHLLVVTREFQSQKLPVSHGDMLNGGLVCEALEGILFFNGGDLSGASQPHKHLQVLPNEARELPIFAEMLQWTRSLPEDREGQVLRFQKFDFLHGVVAIRSPKQFQPLGQLLYRAYQSLYSELITKNKGQEESTSDYNLVACESFVLMAVRRKEFAFDEISVNSLGFMGSLLFKNEQTMQQFMKSHSPSRILSDISLPLQ